MLSNKDNFGIHRREATLGSLCIHFGQLDFCQVADNDSVSSPAIPYVLKILANSFLPIFAKRHNSNNPRVH
jgi:hypothetical protein